MDISITHRTRFFCLSILIALFVISTLSVSYVNSTSILIHNPDGNPTTKDWSIDTDTTVPDSITLESRIKLEFIFNNTYSVAITRLDFRFFANDADTTTPKLVREFVEHRVIPANSAETINIELRFSNINTGNIDYPSADDNTSSSQIFLNTIRHHYAGHDANNLSVVHESDTVVSGSVGNVPLNFYHEDADLDEDNVKNGVEASSNLDFTSNDSDGDMLYDGDEINDYGTSASRADTDDDGLTDWEEVMDMSLDSTISDSLLKGADPNKADTDSDGALDGKEVELGSNLTDNDTDDDGLLDGTEINLQAITITYQSGVGFRGANTTENLNVSTSLLNNDTDDDGLSDGEEIIRRTDPTDNDTDGDSLLDGAEIVNHSTNPLDIDTNNDGVSDDKDPDPTNMDIDDDGLSNSEESQIGTDIRDNDSDDDRLNDFVEVRTYNTEPNDNDTDNDGLLDGDEVLGFNTSTGTIYTSDPHKPDTDGDTLNDLEEVTSGEDGYITNPRDTDTDDDKLLDHEEGPLGTKTDPTKADTDGDGLDDLREGVLETDATDNDTDDDGLSDGDEVLNYTTNAKDNDSDRDGLSDGAEVNEYKTDPLKPDTDGDGFSDYDEVTRYDTDPLDRNSFPTGLVSDTTSQNMNGDDGSGIAFWVYIVVLLVAVAVIGAIVALSMVRARTQ